MSAPPDYRALADEGERYITDRTPINPWQAVQTRDDLIERMAIALRHAAQEREALEKLTRWAEAESRAAWRHRPRNEQAHYIYRSVAEQLRAALTTPTGGK